MTSNTTPPPFVVTASSEDAGGANFIYRAFDNDLTYSWQCLPGEFPPAWIQVDWGNRARVLKQYIVHWSFLFFLYKRAPRDWQVQGSHNGTDWVDLDTRSGQTDWLSNPRRTFTYPDTPVNKVAYRYTRLYITANNGAGPDGDAFITNVNQWHPDGIGQASRCY